MAYKEQDQETKQESKWGKCSASGCPLDSSFNAGDNLCSFHAGKEPSDFGELTMAINECMGDYKQYCSMIRWSGKLWIAKLPLLKMDGKVDMSIFTDEHFDPGTYINKFRAYLETSINARAQDIRINPNQRVASEDSQGYSDDGLWRN